MSKTKGIRDVFDPNSVPLIGSLGILALGDVGFEAWRKVKIENNLIEVNEKK
jgi:hypothetical protein